MKYSIVDGAETSKGGLTEDTWIVESLVFVQPTEQLHLFRAQVEVEDGYVFNKTVDLTGLRNSHSSSLNSKS